MARGTDNLDDLRRDDENIDKQGSGGDQLIEDLKKGGY